MQTEHKILALQDFLEQSQTQLQGKKLAMTNGCFDLLHPGHVYLLQQAKAFGDFLLIGLNSDQSVQRLKGAQRPIMPAMDRARVLSGLDCVDFIVLFDEDTPLALIQAVQPQVLIKGGDWAVQDIIGREAVQAQDGLVLSLPLFSNYSSSQLIQRVLQLHGCTSEHPLLH